MLATDRTGMIVPSLFAVIMHEIGHLFAMWLLECAPKRIKLIPASIQITSPFSKGYRNDIIIAVCGPLTNFVIFFALYANYMVFNNKITLYYALLNLIIGLFNSLPVKGLDGGTILFSLLVKKLEYNKAMLILRFITLAVALALIISAIYFTVKGKVNLSLYIIGIYLIVMSILKM